jgi:hypothetical protein
MHAVYFYLHKLIPCSGSVYKVSLLPLSIAEQYQILLQSHIKLCFPSDKVTLPLNHIMIYPSYNLAILPYCFVALNFILCVSFFTGLILFFVENRDHRDCVCLSFIHLLSACWLPLNKYP